MAEIIPTILTASFSELVAKLKSLEGICPRVSVDIIDGKFVPNQTITLESLKNEQTDLKLDLHLLVKEPEEWVNRAIEILPDRLIGQVEMMYDPKRFIKETVEGGMEVGLALDLETKVESIPDEIYHMVDLVLVLAAKAGFSGQEFDKRALEKVEKIRKLVGNLVEVGVDCGLDEKTIPLCHKAGASIFYINHSFWKEKNLLERYNQLTELINP